MMPTTNHLHIYFHNHTAIYEQVKKLMKEWIRVLLIAQLY